MQQLQLKEDLQPKREPIRIFEEHPLSEEEFLCLNDQIVEATAAGQAKRGPQVEVIRYAHQEIARLRAAGFKVVDIAEAVGYSYGGVMTILSKPATQALVAEYAGKRDNALEIIDLQLRGTAAESLAALRSKVRTSGEDMSADNLRKIAEGMLDRIGKSPVRKSVQANINSGLSPEDLEEIKSAVRNGGSVKQREITLEDGRDYQVVDAESGVAAGPAENEGEGKRGSGDGVPAETDS